MIKIDENNNKVVTYDNEPDVERQLFPNIPLTVDISPLQDEIDALDERVGAAEDDINSIQTTLQTFNGQPVVVDSVDDMTDENIIYVYVGDEAGYTSGDWYYYDGTEWVSGGAYVANPVVIDDTLTHAGEAADAKATGDEITDVKTALDEIKSDFDELEKIALKYQSSTLVGTASVAANARYLLYDKPILANIHLGDLWLVSNDSALNLTITVELTTRNDDGTYSVYDTATGSVSYSGISTGDLVRIFDINKITQKDGTYVFVSYTTTSQYPRIKMASVTGHNLVICDTTSGTTFTTRDITGYELCYLVYAGITSTYADGLKNSLDVLNNAVGDYTYHQFFNAAQSSGFWNNYIYKNVPAGTKLRVTMLSNTANLAFNVRAYDSSNNSQLIKGIFKDVGGTAEATLTINAVQFRIQAPISSAITNAKLSVVLSTDTEPGIVSELFNSRVSHIYHVEKDGSGDFTNLATAIDVATQWMDSIVYIGAGTWDILEELGQDYLDTASSTNQGIVLKNRVHVICSSKAYIKCLYDGTDADVIDHISAFNAGQYGFTLENADIEVANIRYCVHDERNAETEHYDNYYLNCRMKNTNQTPGSRSQCIGGGLGYDGHVVIDGCTFENPLRENYGIVSYHNAHGAATDSRSLIEVKGSYFYGKNTFRAGYYGNATAITQCLVHGNSMGAEPFVAQEDQNYSNVNMEIIAWGNDIRTS